MEKPILQKAAIGLISEWADVRQFQAHIQDLQAIADKDGPTDDGNPLWNNELSVLCDIEEELFQATCDLLNQIKDLSTKP